MEQSQNKKWAFIINPVAGNGKSLVVEKELKLQVEQRGIDSKIVYTQRKDHAKQLTKMLADEGYNIIVAVGGDGTFNEVASEMVHLPNCTLGLIPAGTGNDFVQILGIPEKFQAEDWDVFFETNTKKLDVGKCNGNYFFNGMGLGFDAQVASENYIEPDQVKSRTKNLYVWHIVKNLLFYKESKTTVQINGYTLEGIYFMNTISIGRRYAGGFFITPKALANDGLLDICTVSKLNLLQRLNILMKVPKGTHLSHRKVNYQLADKLIMEVEKESAYHLDGELFFDTKFEIELLPGKLEIIYNPRGKHFFKN